MLRVVISMFIVNAALHSVAVAQSSFLQRNRSQLSDLVWQEMTKRLPKYPMALRKPGRQKLLVRTATDLTMLYASVEWTTTRKADTRTKTGWKAVALASAQASYYIHINLGDDADKQLQKTVEGSFERSYSSTRGSTWSRDGNVKCLSIPGANFVANATPIKGFPDYILYCIENVAVRAQSSFPLRTPVPKGRLIEVAEKFNSIFGDTTKLKCEVPKAGELALTIDGRRPDGSVKIKWSATGSLKDYWVRVDTEHGELSIVKGEQKILLSRLPAAGTVVHCYAISPDGKNWLKTQLAIPEK